MHHWKSSKTLSLLALLALLCACHPLYYAPVNHTIPLFKEKGDLRLNAELGLGDVLSRRASASVAYSATKNLAFFSSYSRGWINNDSWGECLELGGGCYKDISKSLVTELYCGVGAGQGKHYSREAQQQPDGTSKDVELHYNWTFSRYFIQPTIGCSWNYFTVGFSPKLVFLGFNSFQTQNVQATSEWLEKPPGYTIYPMFEPGFVARAGAEGLWGQFQLGLTSNMASRPLEYDRVYISTGIYFIIDKLFSSAD